MGFGAAVWRRLHPRAENGVDDALRCRAARDDAGSRQSTIDVGLLRLVLPVHRLRVERPLRVAEFKRDRAGLAERHRAIEAGAPAGMAGPRPHLLDLDPDRVLIAVDAHLDHALHVAGALPLAPERPARAAEVPGLPGRDRPLKRLRVHVRDHEHLARARVGGHAGDEAVGIEFGRERAAFFDLFGRAGLGEYGGRVGQCFASLARCRPCASGGPSCIIHALSSPRKRGPIVPHTVVAGIWVPACAGTTTRHTSARQRKTATRPTTQASALAAATQRSTPRSKVMKRTWSSGLSRKLPVKCVVMVEEPGFSTPRTDMHMCSASSITATPRGLRISSMAVAICEVMCSWVCSRRA